MKVQNIIMTVVGAVTFGFVVGFMVAFSFCSDIEMNQQCIRAEIASYTSHQNEISLVQLRFNESLARLMAKAYGLNWDTLKQETVQSK